MVEQQVQQRKKKSPPVANLDYGREMVESDLTFNPTISFSDDDWREIDAAAVQRERDCTA